LSKEITEIISSYAALPVSECRAAFNTLEQELFKQEQIEECDYQLVEYLNGGMYGRQITVPENALITGRIYLFDHMEIMLSGEISILSADGGVTHYEGYNVIEAKAGKRQAGFAHKETVWLTLNQAPDSIPLSELLNYTSVETYEEYESFHESINQIDYQQFLLDVGLDQDQMDEIVNTDDVVAMTEEHDHIHIGSSNLDGIGLFTSKAIEAGSIICPVRIDDKRTIAGRYANHALNRNCVPIIYNGVYSVMAIKPIGASEEITMNYREVLMFRDEQGDL